MLKNGWTGTVLLLAVFGLLTACADRTEEEAPGATVTAGQIIENPNAYVGKTVTVTGEVEDLHGPRAFTLDSGLNFGELLVLGADPFPQVPDDGGNRAYVVDDTATVTGKVALLVTAEIERELGWDLEPQLEAEFERKPVLIATRSSFTPRRATASPTATATTAMPSEVQDFVQFVQNQQTVQPGVEHEYTSTGIQRLAKALTALANRADIREQKIEQKRDLLTQRVAGLQQNPASLQHADLTRQAFLAATDLLGTIQQKAYPNLSGQVTQVRQAAEAVNPKQPLLEQTNRVETFFQRASSALQAMAHPAG